MSPLGPVGKFVGAASIAAGVAGAAALGGITAQRRAVKRYREAALHAAAAAGDDRYDSLVADRSYSVVAEDGTVLYVEEVGPRDADLTVVFSHGWMLRSGAWHYQRLGLAGPGFGEPPGPVPRLVFFDQRSHGRSTRAAAGHSTTDDLASDLASVIRTAVPDGPLVVVAHSMGGMGLLTLAGRDPELIADRLSGAALVSTASTQLAQPEVSRLVTGSTPVLRMLSNVASRYPTMFERGRAGSKDAVWLLTRALGFARNDVPPALVDYLDEMISDTPVEVIADFTPTLLGFDETASLPALAGIPVMVICGAADRVTPVARSRTIADSLPESQFVIVPEAGHMAMMESPAVVNEALRGLLRTVAAREGIRVSGRKRGA
jgi:pimeloyl-ACP methyl ester carboxylesterase